MRELIYAPAEVEELIKREWRDARITDASDSIHTERFELQLNVSEELFYRFAIRNGFALTCLSLRCRMMEGDKEVKKWLRDELDKETEDNTK